VKAYLTNAEMANDAISVRPSLAQGIALAAGPKGRRQERLGKPRRVWGEVQGVTGYWM
jgi:hypothetical protein